MSRVGLHLQVEPYTRHAKSHDGRKNTDIVTLGPFTHHDAFALGFVVGDADVTLVDAADPGTIAIGAGPAHTFADVIRLRTRRNRFVAHATARHGTFYYLG